jgi:hypothetical protein
MSPSVLTSEISLCATSRAVLQQQSLYAPRHPSGRMVATSLSTSPVRSGRPPKIQPQRMPPAPTHHILR